MKYAAIGAFATVVNIAVAMVCAAFLWRCLGPGDFLVVRCGFPEAGVTDAVRAVRAVGCNFVGFLVANVACWLLNRKFVFRPGRHRWFVEYALFLAGSALAIFVGSALIWALVRFCGTQTTYSFVINVLASLAINFFVRKFFVFKG